MNRSTITNEMKLEAAHEIADRLEADVEPEEIANSFRRGMSGYELAKNIDEYNFYNFSMTDVEELDCMYTIVRKLLREAERSWVSKNGIEPKLDIGTQIKQGEIKGVSEYTPARYQVKENGCTQHGRLLLIKFEDAIAV